MRTLILAWIYLGIAFFVGLATPRPPELAEKQIIVNPAENKWQHDPGDPPGSQSILLREDAKTSGIELLARYPAGHVFPPHWHSANERIVLVDGRLSIKNGSSVEYLERGGFAYLPAKEVQRMECVSQTPCSFYVYWDRKLDFHKESELPSQ
jgi:anti-sigma factor ChrR (cupin superfamily)